MGTDDSLSTAAQLVMAIPPPDDAGAKTADRYDWQASMAAAHGLRLYLDAIDREGFFPTSNCRIVCEHHEDWVVIDGNDAELVSAKHRDPSNSVYTTVNTLVNDGGLAHMFGRWLTMEEKPTCRLVTTAGLGPGPVQGLESAAKKLRNRSLERRGAAVDDIHDVVVTDLAKAFVKSGDNLPESWHAVAVGESGVPTLQQRKQTARFLSMLVIQHGMPTRDYIQFAAPAMYAKPVLERLGVETSPEAVWEAVLALFRVRMRARGPIRTGALPAVLAYRPGMAAPGPLDIQRELAGRIVTLADINVAIQMAIINPNGYRPLPRVIRTSRIAVKMDRGGCSDNAIERAEQLRLDYKNYWRSRASDDPTARAEQERMRRYLLRVNDAATTAVVSHSGVWGLQLWRELQTRFVAEREAVAADGLDPDLLLGGVCELANRCKVWFSERFDVDAEIARLRAQQGRLP